VKLDKFYIEQNKKIYKSPESEYAFGIQKSLLWDKLYFLLSVKGLMPLSDLCDTIRYDGDVLTCATEYEKLCKISFDKCYYFGDNKVHKLVTKRRIKNARYKIFDRVAFNRGGKHDIDYLKTGDDFVREVWFYSSDRVCGDTGVKDACVLSILTDDELKNNDYTQTMTSFKLIHSMKHRGMKGKFNGYTKNGTARYYNFRTSHIDRSVYLIDLPEWEETEKVKNINTSVEELIKTLNNMDLKEHDYLNGPKL
jgi:hypothetical protein